MIHALSSDGIEQQLPPAGSNRHVGGDRTLVVHRVHDPSIAVSAVDQLMQLSRATVPSVLNYLYFGAANVAVVYFGKTVVDGIKVGIDGGEDMKIRMLRFLTSEIWPQLLRTDVPDESQMVNEADSPNVKTPSDQFAESYCGVNPLAKNCADSIVGADGGRVTMHRQRWLQKSLDSGMQVLVFLKPGARGTKYLKLILANSLKRIHFDIADSKEEKYRWDNRMLYIRMLDNLETQKAIDSYDTYERYFKEACACAATNCVELERADQPLVRVVYHLSPDATDRLTSPEGCDGSATPLCTPTSAKRVFARRSRSSSPAARSHQTDAGEAASSVSAYDNGVTIASRSRHYRWFENLEKPESLTLDYKSYFVNPAAEVQFRAVKFMCGFLNGIGQGKLVVGVHEMEKQLPTSSSNLRTPSSVASSAVDVFPDGPGAGAGGSFNSIVTHNMLIEQLVVGVAVSDADIEAVQLDLSEQLQQCIPPIPPQAVQIDVVPVVFPTHVCSPGYMLLLFDTAASGYRDSFRQKSNHAIRQLRRIGYSLCPFDFTDRAVLRRSYPTVDGIMPENVTAWQLYAIAPIVEEATQRMSDASFHKDVQRIVDAHTKSKGAHAVVRLDEVRLPQLRILEVSVDLQRCGEPLASYKGKFFNGWPSIPIWNPMTESITRVDRNYYIFSRHHPQTKQQTELLPSSHSLWYRNGVVVNTVFAFACGSQYPRSSKSRKLRLLHSSFNAAFELQLGVPLVEMLQSTPVGTPGFKVPRPTVALLQTSLKVSRLSFMPLLLVHVHEILGTLLSPFPYVATPASLQCMRVAPHLVPIYMREDFDLMTLRPEIVLDVHDGCLKALRWCDGAVHMETVVGVGFSKISKQMLESRARTMVMKKMTRTKSLRNVKAPLLVSPSTSGGKFSAPPLQHCVPLSSNADDSSSSCGMMSPQPSTNSYCDIAEYVFPPSSRPKVNVRRVENNIPLLQFEFLCGDNMKLYHGAPWTLITLLKWLRTAAHDSRVRAFGNCDRSFALYADVVKEVCNAHVGEFLEGDDDAGTSPTSHYASSFDCTLCRLMLDWNDANK